MAYKIPEMIFLQQFFNKFIENYFQKNKNIDFIPNFNVNIETNEITINFQETEDENEKQEIVLLQKAINLTLSALNYEDLIEDREKLINSQHALLRDGLVLSINPEENKTFIIGKKRDLFKKEFNAVFKTKLNLSKKSLEKEKLKQRLQQQEALAVQPKAQERFFKPQALDEQQIAAREEKKRQQEEERQKQKILDDENIMVGSFFNIIKALPLERFKDNITMNKDIEGRNIVQIVSRSLEDAMFYDALKQTFIEHGVTFKEEGEPLIMKLSVNNVKVVVDLDSTLPEPKPARDALSFNFDLPKVYSENLIKSKLNFSKRKIEETQNRLSTLFEGTTLSSVGQGVKIDFLSNKLQNYHQANDPELRQTVLRDIHKVKEVFVKALKFAIEKIEPKGLISQEGIHLSEKTALLENSEDIPLFTFHIYSPNFSTDFLKRLEKQYIEEYKKLEQTFVPLDTYPEISNHLTILDEEEIERLTEEQEAKIAAEEKVLQERANALREAQENERSRLQAIQEEERRLQEEKEAVEAARQTAEQAATDAREEAAIEAIGQKFEQAIKDEEIDITLEDYEDTYLKQIVSQLFIDVSPLAAMLFNHFIADWIKAASQGEILPELPAKLSNSIALKNVYDKLTVFARQNAELLTQYGEKQLGIHQSRLGNIQGYYNGINCLKECASEILAAVNYQGNGGKPDPIQEITMDYDHEQQMLLFNIFQNNLKKVHSQEPEIADFNDFVTLIPSDLPLEQLQKILDKFSKPMSLKKLKDFFGIVNSDIQELDLFLSIYEQFYDTYSHNSFKEFYKIMQQYFHSPYYVKLLEEIQRNKLNDINSLSEFILNFVQKFNIELKKEDNTISNFIKEINETMKPYHELGYLKDFQLKSLPPKFIPFKRLEGRVKGGVGVTTEKDRMEYENFIQDNQEVFNSLREYDEENDYLDIFIKFYESGFYQNDELYQKLLKQLEERPPQESQFLNKYNKLISQLKEDKKALKENPDQVYLRLKALSKASIGSIMPTNVSDGRDFEQFPLVKDRKKLLSFMERLAKDFSFPDNLSLRSPVPSYELIPKTPAPEAGQPKIQVEESPPPPPQLPAEVVAKREALRRNHRPPLPLLPSKPPKDISLVQRTSSPKSSTSDLLSETWQAVKKEVESLEHQHNITGVTSKNAIGQLQQCLEMVSNNKHVTDRIRLQEIRDKVNTLMPQIKDKNVASIFNKVIDIIDQNFKPKRLQPKK